MSSLLSPANPHGSPLATHHIRTHLRPDMPHHFKAHLQFPNVRAKEQEYNRFHAEFVMYGSENVLDRLDAELVLRYVQAGSDAEYLISEPVTEMTAPYWREAVTFNREQSRHYPFWKVNNTPWWWDSFETFRQLTYEETVDAFNLLIRRPGGVSPSPDIREPLLSFYFIGEVLWGRLNQAGTLFNDPSNPTNFDLHAPVYYLPSSYISDTVADLTGPAPDFRHPFEMVAVITNTQQLQTPLDTIEVPMKFSVEPYWP